MSYHEDLQALNARLESILARVKSMGSSDSIYETCGLLLYAMGGDIKQLVYYSVENNGLVMNEVAEVDDEEYLNIQIGSIVIFRYVPHESGREVWATCNGARQMARIDDETGEEHWFVIQITEPEDGYVDISIEY